MNINKTSFPFCETFANFQSVITLSGCSISAPINLVFAVVLLRYPHSSLTDALLGVAALSQLCLHVCYTVFTVSRRSYEPYHIKPYWLAMLDVLTMQCSLMFDAMSQFMLVTLTFLFVFPWKKPNHFVLFISAANAGLILLLCIPMFMSYEIKPKPLGIFNNETHDRYYVKYVYNNLSAKVFHWISGVFFKLLPCIVLSALFPLIIVRFLRIIRSAEYKSQISALSAQAKLENREHRKTKTSMASKLETVPLRGVEQVANVICRLEQYTVDAPETATTYRLARLQRIVSRARLLCCILLMFLAAQLPVAVSAIGSTFNDSIKNFYRECGYVLDIVSIMSGSMYIFIYCIVSDQFRLYLFERIIGPFLWCIGVQMAYCCGGDDEGDYYDETFAEWEAANGELNGGLNGAMPAPVERATHSGNFDLDRQEHDKDRKKKQLREQLLLIDSNRSCVAKI